ncbi:unnamed protein product [Prunus armeniaca]|uniref:Uncharacterized protein n=1 Tax=Prunus armeniaca TaxID=36596 RepID=A0A6J5UG73_PRUAR|nr:unnamed protein product [Prunus armeniaca]
MSLLPLQIADIFPTIPATVSAIISSFSKWDACPIYQQSRKGGMSTGKFEVNMPLADSFIN